MAGIIPVQFNVSGLSLYVNIRLDLDGTIWNGSALEAFNGANVALYDLALTEDTDTGWHQVNIPASLPAGDYTCPIFEYASPGSPSYANDNKLGAVKISYDGSNAVRLHTILANTVSIETDTQDIQSRIPSALVGGRIDSDVGAKTGNVALSTQEKLDVNAEVDSAMNTAIPGSPTADSINERIKTMDDNQPEGIKKNTALANFEFLMIDETDNISPKTGLTVTGQVSIDGAAFSALSNSVSELSNGIYKINLSSDDLNGDVIMLRFSATGADDRFIEIKTSP